MKSKEQIAIETGSEVIETNEFMMLVDMGAFNGFDGSGYFHDGENKTDIWVWDENLMEKDIEKYPYVCWYGQ